MTERQRLIELMEVAEKAAPQRTLEQGQQGMGVVLLTSIATSLATLTDIAKRELNHD